MAKIRLVPFPTRNFENLFEMQNLRRAGHDPDRVRFQIVNPVIDRREISGGVIVAAIAFANDARLVRQLGNVAKENANGAFADFRNAGLEQPLHHTGQSFVVKTLAALDVVMNIEKLVCALEFLPRQIDRLFPDGVIFRVTRLQFHQFLPARLAGGRIGRGAFIGFFINADKLGNRIARKRFLVEKAFPAVNHHPKLRAPIADMVVANDFVAEELGDARKCITQDGAADVTDMHRLGYVGRSKIDHDPTWRCCFGDAEAFILQKLAPLFRDRFSTQSKIDESGPGNCRRLA